MISRSYESYIKYILNDINDGHMVIIWSYTPSSKKISKIFKSFIDAWGMIPKNPRDDVSCGFREGSSKGIAGTCHWVSNDL